MKKLWFGLLVFLCLAAGIGIASAAYARAYNYGPVRFIWGSGAVGLYNTEEFETEGISNIDVNYSSESIYLYESETDKIVVKEYRMKNRTGDTSKAEVIDDTLYIEKSMAANTTNIFLFSFSSTGERIEIYLPETYYGGMQLKTTSGDIKAESNWRFDKFSADTSSGEINCGDIKAKEVRGKSTSGDITFDKVQGIINLEASSGSIKVRKGEGNISVSATSGDIVMKEITGSFKATASSGNISAEFAKSNDNISAETTSGDIKLTIPDSSAFIYEGRATSGEIRTDFDQQLSFNERRNTANGTYGENATATVNTSASSGSTYIRLN